MIAWTRIEATNALPRLATKLSAGAFKALAALIYAATPDGTVRMTSNELGNALKVSRGQARRYLDELQNASVLALGDASRAGLAPVYMLCKAET
jgi:response regulator of citrate/malate metabolism